MKKSLPPTNCASRYSSFSQDRKDIAIFVEGVPGMALGCLMVDHDRNMLWHKPFVKGWPFLNDRPQDCYNLLGSSTSCETCAAIDVLRTGRPSSCEQMITQPDGGSIYYHLVASPVKDKDQNIIGVVEVIQDISSQSTYKDNYKDIINFNYNIIFNAPVAIFTLNRQGIITSTNPAHCQIAGNPPLVDILGMDWLNSRSVIESGLDYYLKKGLSGESFEVVDVHYRTNITGIDRFITLRGVPLRTNDGSIEGLLCILEDTTEKTNNLMRVEKLKRYNDNIIQSISNGIMVLDNNFSIKIWNNFMENIFGMPAKKVLGRSAIKFLPSLGLDIDIKSIFNATQEGNVLYFKSVDINCKNKGFISINYKVMPLINDENAQSGIIVFFEDITQSKKTEIQYNTLFQNANDGIVVTDLQGRFLSANAKFLNLITLTWLELQAISIEDLIFADDIHVFQNYLMNTGDNGDVVPLEIRLSSKKNDPIPVEINLSRVIVQNENVAFQLIVRDIRERLKLEKQLFRASKLSALGELAAGVAHEINNPLATIAGYSEELLDLLKTWKMDLIKPHLRELKEIINMIKTQSYRCKSITNNLLDFARVNAPTYSDVDINEIIYSVLSLSAYITYENKNRVKLDLMDDMPLLKIDYSHAQQVMLNILNNAFDAIEDSGDIIISSKEHNNYISVIFKDTGIGIDKKNMERIFDPFFTTKSPDKGTGLGLSISYRIMERLGGSIDVKSKKSAGSTFELRFPKE